MSDMDRYSRWHNADDPGTISEPAAPRCTCEHHGRKRVLRITGRDGQTTEFLDRAVRFLVVVPDPTTAMSTPSSDSNEPVHRMNLDVVTYVYADKGELIPEGDPCRERTRLVDVDPEPKELCGDGRFGFCGWGWRPERAPKGVCCVSARQERPKVDVWMEG